MTVKDAAGVSHDYVRLATSLRRAKRDARKWVAGGRVEGETLIGVRLADESGPRGLIALAGMTFVTGGVVITAAIVVGLSLEGAL